MHRRLREKRLAALAALDDPIRMALRDFVARSPNPVSREQAAAEFGLPRSTAAFHLDRLVAVGLLRVTYRRLSGRTGPGAGRPAKLYEPSGDEVAVSVPDRQYDLTAHVLAETIEESSRTGEPADAVVARVAEGVGRSIGAAAGSLREALDRNGFEPRMSAGGSIALGNCPFRKLAQEYRDLVCGMNLALLTGIAAGCGDNDHVMVPDPDAGHCCVRVDPSPWH
ncbi:MAG: helix-turn-helix domain-containing protein [Actinobacteria bacterium]|nr:helix-turn-helix domain-containing protein [Actinomycetota bacterium]